jgi:hypothetical protein
MADPLSSVVINLRIQEALLAYRDREEDDALLAEKASKAELAQLETQVLQAGTALTTKANLADVYTKESVQQLVTSRVLSADKSSDDAYEALAENLGSAVTTLNQSIENARTMLTGQINGKVAVDVWPPLLMAAKADAANAAVAAASAELSQRTQQLQADIAARAPLQAPSFTGPVRVDGKAVVLTDDPRLATAGPTGLVGPTGPQGLVGPTGTQGAQGVAGPAGAVGPQGVTGAGATFAAGSLVDADVAAGANIAQSKVANLTADLAARAPLASPAFTGTPTAPTAPTGPTGTTQLATTAHVQAVIADRSAAYDATIRQHIATFVAQQVGSQQGKAAVQACATGNYASSVLKWGPFSKSSGVQVLSSLSTNNGTVYPSSNPWTQPEWSFTIRLGSLTEFPVDQQHVLFQLGGNSGTTSPGLASRLWVRNNLDYIFYFATEVGFWKRASNNTDLQLYRYHRWADIDRSRSYLVHVSVKTVGSVTTVDHDLWYADTLQRVPSTYGYGALHEQATMPVNISNWSILGGNSTLSINTIGISFPEVLYAQVYGLPGTLDAVLLDGVTVTPGMRVLLAGQSNSVSNGIYVGATGSQLVRASDMAVGSSAFGAHVFVVGPTGSNNHKGFLCTAPSSSSTVGTHALSWKNFAS